MTASSDPATSPLRLRLIGIGAGTLDQLTGAARAALAECDLVVAAAKRDDDPLLKLRAALCVEAGVELVAVPDPERDRGGADGAGPADYPAAVRDWHDARVEAYADVIAEVAGRADGGSDPTTVGFLVWGDPSLYDSTIRVVRSLVDRLAGRLPELPRATWDVIAGIAAPQLLAAAHGIVLHEVGKPVLITTGRRLLEDAPEHDNLVVMLDGKLVCADLPSPGEWWIWWGANLGTPTQALAAGRLDEVLPEIRARRQAAKDEAGWVMDTYLLSRLTRRT